MAEDEKLRNLCDSCFEKNTTNTDEKLFNLHFRMHYIDDGSTNYEQKKVLLHMHGGGWVLGSSEGETSKMMY